MVRWILLVLGLLLLVEVSAQAHKNRQVKTVSAYNGKRLEMLTRYDRNGNERFFFWDGETTAARAMKYDSFGRLIKQTDAHCNAGCGERTYEYLPGLKRTFAIEFSEEDSPVFPIGEAFRVLLRKAHNVDALDTLPEIVAIRQLLPRLLEEEFSDSLGRVVRQISYETDGDTTTIEFQYNDSGQLIRKATADSRGHSTMVDLDYKEPCKEAAHEHRWSNHVQYWKLGKAGKTSDVYRTCDQHGNTVRSILMDTTDNKVDTVLVEEWKYVFIDKEVSWSSDQYGSLNLQRSNEYDERGNRVKFIAYSAGGPVHLTRSYTYNRHDELIRDTVTEFNKTKVLRYKYEYWKR